MKKVSLFVFSAFILLSACISEQENFNLRMEQDKEAILNYIAANTLPDAKEFKDVPNGFYMFWEVVNPTLDSLMIGDTLYIDYTGKLLNNVVFDTSNDSIARANNIHVSQRDYEPLKFIIGQGGLIQGFQFALSQMKEGEKATALFPSIFGYGPSSQGRIPANSPLVFDLHLVEVRKKPVEE
ncbi:FKBP-type peptidyl-prolyl cis-trans isomerase [Belliella sp. R4-6]|uniref:Peptidyl-prolyl cis-trans isomerase n=1 Tax=Belliella alkalica TaxID=1730871 RepID=A0ABS9VA03_9BACT|nr:FKBP-type peptidyl-prolyl cis-trans isomerase [Belliella alkalica]MCH7413253.1 FKBP-type peptidyl-prolyl cis-trans isomerase [Belliella alkalica]